jgi:8-hydroxy-5-deazaflavin:NADPH oxidoreductase
MLKLKTQEDKLMKIGIIGAGNMGSALGRIWASQGHEVMLSYSRDRTKLDAIAQSIGVRAGIPVEAVQFADVPLLRCVSSLK